MSDEMTAERLYFIRKCRCRDLKAETFEAFVESAEHEMNVWEYGIPESHQPWNPDPYLVLGMIRLAEEVPDLLDHVDTLAALAARLAAVEACAYKLDEIIHSGSCSIYPFHREEAQALLDAANIPPAIATPQPEEER